MKKFIFTFLIVILFIGKVNALEINSKNAVLYNMNDSTIIYEKNKDEITSIASLTKIMTTLVAIEKIDDDSKLVKVDKNMLKGLREANAAVVGLKVGQKVTYKDLLYATFLASGADATRALTISLAGSEAEFVNLMNKKALELGMTNTKFTNTTGLDSKGQTSTVSEVAILLIEALKNETFKEIFYSKSYTLSDKSMTVYSTLDKTASAYKLDVSSFIGGKTGYTTNAGRCLASLAFDDINDITYLLITTNADINNGEHVKDAVRVYDYYFKNYKYHNFVDDKQVILTLPTKYVKEKEISFYKEGDLSVFYENTFNKDDVEFRYNGVNEIKAGSKKGEKLGEIEIVYNDKVYDKVDVILKEDAKFSLLVFIKENKVIVSISTIIFLLLIVLIRKKRK